MIYVVGHTAIDHILEVNFLAEKHQSAQILDHHVYYGGGAANIAAGIANLSGDACLVSAVGADFEGSDYERWLSELGVDCDFFVDQEHRTATAYMINDPDNDQITYFEWGASALFGYMDAPELDFVHMATADPSFNLKVAEKSGFASFDPGQDIHKYSAEDFETIIGNINILFANRHEVATMCSKLGIGESELRERVEIAVFTMDAGGSVLYSGGEEYHVPIIPVDVADPTGAGDAYRAGFLTAFERGYDPLTAARIGTTAASFVVEKVGCQTNLPDWGTMKTRYENAFGKLDEIT